MKEVIDEDLEKCRRVRTRGLRRSAESVAEKGQGHTSGSRRKKKYLVVAGS